MSFPMAITRPITRPVAVPVTGLLTRRAEEPQEPHANGQPQVPSTAILLNGVPLTFNGRYITFN